MRVAVGLFLIAGLAACGGEDPREGHHPRRVPVEGAEAVRKAVAAHDGPVIVEYWRPG